MADPTLAQNQDRITDTVWITRGGTHGLFNAATESSYTSSVSPAGTEWAFGSIADGVEGLSFTPWETWHGTNPRSALGDAAVLHLISDDIYIDITMLTWGSGRSGGGGAFSYSRSTAPVITGDFSGDGKVDAADYTVWRDNLGIMYDDQDYLDWVDNYGAGVTGQAPTLAPAAAGFELFATVCLALLGGTGRRRLI